MVTIVCGGMGFNRLGEHPSAGNLQNVLTTGKSMLRYCKQFNFGDVDREEKIKQIGADMAKEETEKQQTC